MRTTFKAQIYNVLFLIVIFLSASCDDNALEIEPSSETEVPQQPVIDPQLALEETITDEAVASSKVSFSAIREGDSKYDCISFATISYDRVKYSAAYNWELYKDGVKIDSYYSTNVSTWSFNIENETNGTFQIKVSYTLFPYNPAVDPAKSGIVYSEAKSLKFGVPNVGQIEPDWLFSGDICAWEDVRGQGYSLTAYVNGGVSISGATYNWYGGESHIFWKGTSRASRALEARSDASFPATFTIFVKVSKQGYEDVIRSRQLTLQNCVFRD